VRLELAAEAMLIVAVATSGVGKTNE